jgi:predicted nucleic acid-binding protein
MHYYLDNNIVIYAVQAGGPEHQRAISHLAALELAGHRFVISELTRTETLILPFQPGNVHLLQDFFRFFHGPNLQTVGLTAAMHARASAIRGNYSYPAIPPAQPKRYGLADSLHLAAAIESSCDVFLTNDEQLASFHDITIEELP